MRLRADVFRFLEVYKKYVGKPFKNAYLMDRPCPGARESRRIVGEYVLTLEDILSAATLRTLSVSAAAS